MPVTRDHWRSLVSCRVVEFVAEGVDEHLGRCELGFDAVWLERVAEPGLPERVVWDAPAATGLVAAGQFAVLAPALNRPRMLAEQSRRFQVAETCCHPASIAFRDSQVQA